MEAALPLKSCRDCLFKLPPQVIHVLQLIGTLGYLLMCFLRFRYLPPYASAFASARTYVYIVLLSALVLEFALHVLYLLVRLSCSSALSSKLLSTSYM